MPISVVDLFCGVGGMTHGFHKEGFNVIAGVDVDAACKFAYERNNFARFVEADVAEVEPKTIAALFPKGHTKVLVGCAPCQPFSLYTNRSSPDEKWRLLDSFARLVEGVKPAVVSMENVPLLRQHRVFKRFVARLEKCGYFVTHFIADGRDYGIPQRRARLVLFASLHSPITLIPRTHKAVRTVRQAIGNLEPLPAGGISKKDPLHRSRALSELNLKRIRATSTGGSWADWEDDLRLACHKKKKGASFRSVYGRMSWDEPASVMTTQFIGLGNGRFGHPEQDRAISLREAAIFQTFPKTYQFIAPNTKRVSMQAIARQIGNAVPVRLGRIIARSIRRHLEEQDV